MKRFIVAVCSILFFITHTSAQSIDTTIAIYADKFGQERTYLHYDKSTYAPGETIWFKAYLMNGIYAADESKTFYTDFTDENGTLLAHLITPIVEANTNGQFDIPAGYTGRYIHVKAYTKWMLNFDSSFLYHKDIRILSKNTGATVDRNNIIPAIQFFPEGGDAIAGVVNKIAFKANDQWGRPLRIKGVIKNNRGITADTIRTMHDGMGYFFINPKPEENFSAKWSLMSTGKDEKTTEHITELPAVRSAGVALQLTASGSKRIFSIITTPDVAASLRTIHIIGTMNQYEVFKISKDITSGTAKGAIPTQELPTGILTITVFDDQWKPLAERIAYINNEDYYFTPEMSVEHWGLNKRARNEIQITLPDSIPSNLSVSVTDADIDTDSSDNIIAHLLLTGEIKGQVYNPSHYFLNTSDSISQQLDLVMLTHGWRRFNWEEVAKGKLPKIIFPKDTSYLTISGKVYGATPAQLRDAANIVLIISQKKAGENKMLVLPVEPNGTFNDPSAILFDTAHIYYRLSKGISDASVQFLENRLSPFRYNTAATGIFNNHFTDTAGFYRHYRLADEMAQILKLYEGKLLENVVVKAKTKSPLQIMDEKYSSGLFSGGDGYQFDLINDVLASSSQNIFNYLQGKVAGLQINSNGSASSMQWRGGTPQLYVDEVPADISMVASISVSDIAYIKVFRPPFFGGSGNSSNGAIVIYTRRGNDVKPEPGKGLSNNAVSGYSEIRQFYSPNYSSFNAANEKKDIRSTLYWNPQVVTTAEKNKVKLTFYNNDVSRAFRVVIEGMTKDGRLAHLEQIME